MKGMHYFNPIKRISWVAHKRDYFFFIVQLEAIRAFYDSVFNNSSLNNIFPSFTAAVGRLLGCKSWARD